LILSDLDVYKSRLGSGPCYIRDQNPAQLVSALENIIGGVKFKVDRNIYDNLLEISQTRIRLKELYGFLNKIVNNETNIKKEGNHANAKGKK
jgi:hypothetical protein